MSIYLTVEQILTLHAEIIDSIGGIHGIRDIHRIEAMIKRPKQQLDGKDLYKTVFEKAAVYFEVCAYNHPFVDGNKRTAISIAGVFMMLNNYRIVTSNKDLEQFVLDAVTKTYDIQTLARWFKKNSKKIR